MDDARETLMRLSGESGESLAALSRMLRRNGAYLQQFVHRGSPRRLAESDRRLLAAHFAVDESLLGGPPRASESVAVPYLAVRASAGPGLASDGERLVRAEPFAPRLLRDAGVSPTMASLIEASGDSMAPGILDGDRLLVDRGDTSLVVAPAIFVFRREGELAVKRLTRERGMIRVASDNPEYPAAIVDRGEIVVVGRVKLLLRQPK